MKQKTVVIKTEKQFTSLTNIINDFLKENNASGIVNVFVRHTTCAIKIMEGEILLLSDVASYLQREFPKDGEYRHDMIEVRDVPVNERINGFSHMQQLFFSCGVSVPVKDGKMLLGKWQDVFLIEFDPVRDREIVITLLESV